MSRIDESFYASFWPTRTVGPVVESSPPTPARRVEVLPTTNWAETAAQVSEEAEAERDRLTDLVAEGLSPLEAARRLFAPIDERNDR